MEIYIVSLVFIGMIICHLIVGNLYKCYFALEKNKLVILIGLFVISLFIGFLIYWKIYGLAWYTSFYYGLTQFIGEVKLPVELGLNDRNSTISSLPFEEIQEDYALIYISAFLAFLTSFLTLLLVFFKDVVKKAYVSHMSKGHDYTLVIGLGENNRAYIAGEVQKEKKDKSKDKSIIVIEKNKNHTHMGSFESKGVGFLLGTIEDHKIFFERNFPKNILISVGNDRENIDITSTLNGIHNDSISRGKSPSGVTVYIHLDNHNYESMYRQRILAETKLLDVKDNKKNNISIDCYKQLTMEYKPYSFYDDAARNLFMNHTILGNFDYNIASEKRNIYSIILLGSGQLAKRIIYHLSMTAQLPNNDIFNIICIDENANDFLEKVKSNFFNIDKINTVRLCAYNLKTDSKQFYKSVLWEKDNLTNLILCNDDENVNLANAVSLYDKVFLRKIKANNFKTKVLIAMYHNLELGKTINVDQKDFKNFYTFGTIKDICSKEHLVRESQETLAKLIHFGYGDIYDKGNKNFNNYISDNMNIKDEIIKRWQDYTLYSDRESNRSQALHIDTKLLALGLRRKELAGDVGNEVLLEKNKMIFEDKLFSDTSNFEKVKENILKFSEQLILSYKGCPFDKIYIEDFYDDMMKGDSILSRLMKSEHVRWNAFHYLNGWRYNKNKDKPKKEHDCLTNIESFSTLSHKLTIIYDLYSVLYIPNYLASLNCELEIISHDNILEEDPCEKSVSTLTLGVIGKEINIDEVDLKRYIDEYDKVHICSALVRQDDIKLIKKIIKLDPQKIQKVILPMSENDKQNIEEIKQKIIDISPVDLKNLEFDAFRVYTGKYRDLDKLVEKCVCQKSDILVGSKKYILECIKIGVTGHRILNHENSLNNILHKELKKISKTKKIKSVISPLADGADRVVAKMLIDKFDSTLIVPLPFDKEEYIKDFSVESKKDFDLFISEAIIDEDVCSLKEKTREECYLEVGKKVVNTCDILIALWDDKPENGIGGTGEIVAYAKKKKRAVLHIDTNTLAVEYINFEGLL